MTGYDIGRKISYATPVLAAGVSALYGQDIGRYIMEFDMIQSSEMIKQTVAYASSNPGISAITGAAGGLLSLLTNIPQLTFGAVGKSAEVALTASSYAVIIPSVCVVEGAKKINELIHSEKPRTIDDKIFHF